MNKFICIGRLVRNPELKFIPSSGMAMATVTLAIDRNMSKAKKEEAKAKGMPTADFPRFIAFGKTAETMANYLEKGKMISVIGTLQTSTYKATDGSTKYSTDIIVENFEFINSGEPQATSEGDNIKLPDDFEENKEPDLEEDIPF